MQHSPKTYVARLPAAQADVGRMSDLLGEILDPACAVCAAAEGPVGRWHVEVYFVAPLDPPRLRKLVALAFGKRRAAAMKFAQIAPRDWSAASLAGLAPVHAGRFVVHGAHDRARMPHNRIAIEIEAALAFGTGHHGTTRGCLFALDILAKQKKSLRMLDLGTGTGILAIAAAKMFRARVLASDNDVQAVHTARDNARNNHVGAFVETFCARGVTSPRWSVSKRFDLVLANILLEPLQRLAAPLARKLKPGARVVLSGLLPAHANAAISAYRAQSLSLERRIVLDGWVTLVMARGRGGGRSMHRP